MVLLNYLNYCVVWYGMEDILAPIRIQNRESLFEP